MNYFPLQISAFLMNCLPARVARKRVGDIPAEFSCKSHQFAVSKLLIDVSVIQQSDAHTGIQRVVRALFLQLCQLPPTGYRICPVYATRRQGYRHAAPNFLKENFEGDADIENGPVEVQQGDIFLALDLAAHLLPRHRSQMLDWKRAGVQLHVFVYDLLPLLHPEWFHARTHRNFERWIRWIAVYADSAICISQTVKSQLHSWLKARFNLSPADLTANTIVLGADIGASAPSRGLPSNAHNLLKHMRDTACVLMVGTLEPRKGHDQAVVAFEQLWQQSDVAPSLVIVGKAGWKTEALQEKLRSHPEVNRRIFWLENVSDEYLASLYSSCRGVLVASRAEGFGLPLIEAALHNKPVLARDLPVFREIKLPRISYFDSECPQVLADTLTRWLSSQCAAEDMPSEKIPEISCPTWQLSAIQLVRALGLHHPSNVKSHCVSTAEDTEKSAVSVFNLDNSVE